MNVDDGLLDSPLACLDLSGAPITALVYEDGAAFERLLWSMIAHLRAQGRRLAGVAQINQLRAGQCRCDMIIEELSSGSRNPISQDRGSLAAGCRLDHNALAALTIAVEQSLQHHFDFLIVNKFGNEEIEGRGFRAAIAMAVEKGIPVVIGVRARNLEDWRQFIGVDGAQDALVKEYFV
ncbi:MAG: DUF2478 domain-containing protein [Hyphomicrobiales bacterium]|nr:DUF2478 domain-containing protein [Hyphomicrobiales bacterium]MDE2114975.1 DUF2478 domain-containing protein [Hyphomicrobiales bacterium]